MKASPFNGCTATLEAASTPTASTGKKYLQCVHDLLLHRPIRIPQLRWPTLLIYGKKDPFLRFYHYEPYRNPVQKIRCLLRPHFVVALERASHYIPDQHPKTLAKIINRFLTTP